MTLADIMQGIEQYHFSSELNLAAGTKAFRRGLRTHELVRRLADLAKDTETRLTIAKRVEELSEAEIDTRYENRFDAALSAYLTVLGDTAQPETVAKAASAAAKATNCWWTVGLSRELLMYAVATGFAEAPVMHWHVEPAPFMQRTQWREALREKMQEWFNQKMVSVNDDTTRRILSVLRAAQLQAQAPNAGNVIVMPPSTDEGVSFTERPRGRSRTARLKAAHGTASAHARGSRQAMRA